MTTRKKRDEKIRVLDSPFNIMRAIVSTPAKKPGEWRYVKSKGK